MTPKEFWNSTYRDIKAFVDGNMKMQQEDKKNIIVMYEAMANKIIGALSWSRPKNKSLIKDIFRDLFKEELDNNKPQSIEEQVRILRSMKGK